MMVDCRTGPQDLGSRHKDRAAVLANTCGRCDLKRQGVDIGFWHRKQAHWRSRQYAVVGCPNKLLCPITGTSANISKLRLPTNAIMPG